VNHIAAFRPQGCQFHLTTALLKNAEMLPPCHKKSCLPPLAQSVGVALRRDIERLPTHLLTLFRARCFHSGNPSSQSTDKHPPTLSERQPEYCAASRSTA
jgi:hypothetical protein